MKSFTDRHILQDKKKFPREKPCVYTQHGKACIVHRYCQIHERSHNYMYINNVRKPSVIILDIKAILTTNMQYDTDRKGFTVKTGCIRNKESLQY